ncbi:hypothetical protein FRC04_002181 [Tulasnella sp. 424]|nr:hypothetical protein FRC04_002181 [Tulasnella sp. 424]KAG8967823.1 hypothetical protein FRC05_001919 [Tulasnella sp. 425]
MSHIEFSEDDLIDAMSPISVASCEIDSQRPPQVHASPATLELPMDQAKPVSKVTEERTPAEFDFSRFVVVQVESVLYRVPYALIQQSDVLKKHIPGDDAGDALHVDGISPDEMEAFLDVSDARLVTGDDHFTFKQWTGALAVADRLATHGIRKYVLQRVNDALNRLDPFDCVDAALKYRVQEWLFQPFLRICKRQAALSPAEILRLGPERSGAVGRVREKILRRSRDLEMAWVCEQWPKSEQSPKKLTKPLTVPVPDWAAMSATVSATLAVESKRLVELEKVLFNLDFASPSSTSRSSTGSDPRGIPHAKYGQPDLRAMKIEDRLYQLPIRYFNQPGLLGDHQVEEGSALDSCDTIILPRDVTISDWNVLLAIITARIKTDFPAQDPIDLLEAAKIGSATHSDWLQGIYLNLAQRKVALSPGDIRRVGAEAAADVWKLMLKTK